MVYEVSEKNNNVYVTLQLIFVSTFTSPIIDSVITGKCIILQVCKGNGIILMNKTKSLLQLIYKPN